MSSRQCSVFLWMERFLKLYWNVQILKTTWTDWTNDCTLHSTRAVQYTTVRLALNQGLYTALYFEHWTVHCVICPVLTKSIVSYSVTWNKNIFKIWTTTIQNTPNRLCVCILHRCRVAVHLPKLHDMTYRLTCTVRTKITTWVNAAP